jgi:hypothetical protein
MDGMGWVWSTYVAMNIVSSLAWEEVCGHMLSSIFGPRWHGIVLDNTC